MVPAGPAGGRRRQDGFAAFRTGNVGAKYGWWHCEEKDSAVADVGAAARRHGVSPTDSEAGRQMVRRTAADRAADAALDAAVDAREDEWDRMAHERLRRRNRS